ncbi:tRNA pseudouridine(54/55) synthase Pus10 [Candidatus Micrarchaeota archaeon]|nr:tRNA pseudouridine(54/55) synthase Pus10 [Candidatus Micrarchaeota archaeon]
MIRLCGSCNSRFQKDFPQGPCHICGGVLQSLPTLLAHAEKAMKPEWETFSLSSHIPRQVLSKEEEAWDYSEGESLKSWLNAQISHHIESSTGKRYSPLSSDGRITVDFSTLEADGKNEPLFLFGCYNKLVRGISQSKWVCLKCGGAGCSHCAGKGKMYEESVEEIIGDAAGSLTGGKYTFHASGREDIDVLNFAGRPFVLEVKGPLKIRPDLALLQEKINSQGKVEVSSLKLVPPGSVTLVSDSHFPKTYRAWIDSDQPLTEEDAQKISKFSFSLNQRTPERVAHRRADKIRRRHAQITASKLEQSQLVIDVRADAGTYIKELIHGDNGRTEPSISSFLSKPCTCSRLDVIGMDDDFLSLVLG